MMLQKFRNNQKGFTLIEAMIVVAIIGNFAAIAIPNYLIYRNRGIKSSLDQEAKEFYAVITAYFEETRKVATITPLNAKSTFGIDYVPHSDFNTTGSAGIAHDGVGNITGSAQWAYKGYMAVIDGNASITITKP